MFYFRSAKKRVCVNLDSILDPETTGKWVTFGTRSDMGKLFKETRDYVEKGDLYEVKFMKARRGKGRYAVLVYADKETREFVYDLLKNDFNVHPRWISNQQTRRSIRKRK